MPSDFLNRLIAHPTEPLPAIRNTEYAIRNTEYASRNTQKIKKELSGQEFTTDLGVLYNFDFHSTTI